MRDPSVDARYTSLAATNAPGNDTGQLPVTMTLADHRTTTVALASVLALFATGADEAWMQAEARSQSGSPHLLLAHVIVDDWHVHLFQYVLIFPIRPEGVLAPAGGPASATR